jgi:Zn-dependent peptidase ImmA (M78 family)
MFFMWNLIKDMAEEFNVSKQAMSYRLQNLGLMHDVGGV